MKISDLITMCVQNLLRRKVRTLLTVVGVVVGTCAIVVMISIGVGMQASTDAMLASMGDLTLIEIYNYGSGGGSNTQAKLDDETLKQISQMDGVVVVTPFYQAYDINASIFAGKGDRYEMSLSNVVGIYPEALSSLGIELVDGNGFPTENLKPYGIVFGEKAAYAFRDNKKKPGYNYVDSWPDANGNVKDPFVDLKKDKLRIQTGSNDEDKETKVYTYDLTYYGRMKEDYNKGYETSQGAYMDIDDLKQIRNDYYKANNMKLPEDTGYQNAKVKVTDISKVSEVQKAIEDMGFSTWSLDSIREPMEEQAKQQQLILGGLGAISLFVAALGIANTMIMSIYERTREIGVMKVLGCFVGNIRTIFLMEAGAIGFMGGVIGIILSYMISFAMNTFGFSMSGSDMSSYYGTDVSIIPPWLVALGLIFATCIGLISGFYPANRAVKISADRCSPDPPGASSPPGGTSQRQGSEQSCRPGLRRQSRPCASGWPWPPRA